MITADEIKQRVKKGRGSQLDWFSEDAETKSIAETLVSFANHDGGMVVVGAEHSRIVGTSNPSQVTDHLLEALLTITPILIISSPQIVDIDSKQVVILLIPSGLPHVYAYQGRYLIRDGTHNNALNPSDLRKLLFRRGEVSFESQPTLHGTLDDIQWDRVRDYANVMGSSYEPQQILLRRGCLTSVNNTLQPTNAGILLFGKDPQRFFIGSDIAAVRFAGEQMGDSFSRQDIQGTLLDQIRTAETFLRDHLRKEIHIQANMAREEIFEYPLEAAREVVINAIVHRDYSIQGDNIHLFLFNNRMEVHSPGKLAGTMTLSNLKDARFSRNPVIVQVLSDMHYVEKLGYGVDRVIELMKQKRLHAPEFQEVGGSFHVTLRNSIESTKPEPTRPLEVTAVTYNGRYQGELVNTRQETAITFLKNNPNQRITNSDLKIIFPDVHPETIRRDLADLVNKNILEKQGQKRGSYYVFKQTEQTS